MRFEIRRASDWESAKAPCDGARPTKENALGGKVWEIEVSDLSALLELVKREGPVLISGDGLLIADERLG